MVVYWVSRICGVGFPGALLRLSLAIASSTSATEMGRLSSWQLDELAGIRVKLGWL